MDVCSDRYFCVTALYLISMLAHSYNIINDLGVGAPVHGREVFDGLNSKYKRFLLKFIKTVKLPGAASYDPQTEIHTSTANTDINYAREF